MATSNHARGLDVAVARRRRQDLWTSSLSRMGPGLRGRPATTSGDLNPKSSMGTGIVTLHGSAVKNAGNDGKCVASPVPMDSLGMEHTAHTVHLQRGLYEAP